MKSRLLLAPSLWGSICYFALLVSSRKMSSSWDLLWHPPSHSSSLNGACLLYLPKHYAIFYHMTYYIQGPTEVCWYRGLANNLPFFYINVLQMFAWAQSSFHILLLLVKHTVVEFFSTTSPNPHHTLLIITVKIFLPNITFLFVKYNFLYLQL